MMLLAIFVLTVAMGSFTVALEYLSKGRDAIGWRVVVEAAETLQQMAARLVLVGSIAGAVIVVVVVFLWVIPMMAGGMGAVARFFH